MKKIYYLLFTASFFILSCNNFSPKKNIKTAPLENSIDFSSEENWVSLIQDNWFSNLSFLEISSASCLAKYVPVDSLIPLFNVFLRLWRLIV